jgi:2-oxo-4-hydroxy-4-carboxy-5-ureidoimidazoline decarboxylase
MTLQEFNNLPYDEAKQLLFNCCGASSWVDGMILSRPFIFKEALKEKADEEWSKVNHGDLMEAFSHHPRIGDIDSLKKKFASTAKWASGEQGSVTSASEEVIYELKQMNDEYFEKFGYIFIICASGKSAEEMLFELNARINNDPEKEIWIAAEEQRKIMHLRIEKLLS